MTARIDKAIKVTMQDLPRTNCMCCCCSKPETDLLQSIMNNDVETIRTIITSNEHLKTYKNKTGKTILAIACSDENVKECTVEVLINLGVDLEGNAKWKALHLAVLNRNSSILEVVLKNIKPGQINETVNGDTALLSLMKNDVIRENEEQFCNNIKLLLEAGIDVNKSDSKNLTAILLAAQKGYKHVVETIIHYSRQIVDLDSHKIQNESARDLITKNNLYTKLLPKRRSEQDDKKHILSLIKSEKELEAIQYFDQISSTDKNQFVNWDDGSLTLLQHCCTKGLTRMAEYLINNGAIINRMVNTERDTPLELAAKRGYYEILTLFVQQPQFALADSNILCAILKYSDKIIYSKVNYIQCCHLILDRLKQEPHNFVDVINCKDKMQNTPIHYSLLYADEAITHKLLSLGALLGCRNNFGSMSIQDITPELLEQHLDNCVEFNPKNDQKREFEVNLNYCTLLPPRHDRINIIVQSSAESIESTESMLPKTEVIAPETDVIAYMSKSSEFKSLLRHPLIVSFLLMKWHRIKLLFYIESLIYLVFVSLLVAYIFIDYVTLDPEEHCDVGIGHSYIVYIFLNLMFWIWVLINLFRIVVLPKNYLKHLERWVEIILILITVTILYINSLTCYIRNVLASAAILLAAFELVLIVGQHPSLSTYVVMLKMVSINFFVLLLWSSLLIVAFALSFYILFAKSNIPTKTNGTDSGDDKNQFTDPGKSIFKTILMLTGEFESESINFHTYPVISEIIFSLFVFMITIILSNILNGLAINDTQRIKNNADLIGNIAIAEHIYYIECMLLGNTVPTALLKLTKSLFRCIHSDKRTTYTYFKGLVNRVRLFQKPENYKLVVFPFKSGQIYCKSDLPLEKSSLFFACSKIFSNTKLSEETVKSIFDIKKKDSKKQMPSPAKSYVH